MDPTDTEARLMRLALQLFTLRTIDAVSAFPTLAAQGYEAVELFERPDGAGELRRRLDDAGLEACGWHVGLERLEGELEDVVDQARVLGIGHLVVPWTEPPVDRAGAEALAQRLAGLRDRVTPEGFSLGYHNHGHELEPLADGTVVLDVLAQVDGLELELDLGWAWAAGADPVTLLATHAGRVPLVHAKDFGEGESSTPVGDGVVGFERIVPAMRDAGVEWLVAEQEEIEGDPLEATARSAEFLRRLL
jgi:sugar phosphate isomerase/epimerase